MKTYGALGAHTAREVDKAEDAKPSHALGLYTAVKSDHPDTQLASRNA
jgi:hypothetical protein